MSAVDELRAEAAELYRLLLDTTAERDALSARLQAVRELLDERGLLKADHALYQAFAQLPDASPGTPGNEKPQPSEPGSAE